MTRLTRAWGALEPEQRIAAVAALALLVTMFFPWYELQSLNRRTGAIDSRSISAFGDVSFVEAAVFLVAAGVLALLFARAERRDFHMPGSDGAVVMLAGGWATLLIFYRVFSRPAGHGYPVGIQWGFFLAFVASGVLTYAGWRMRAGSTPEPPLVRTRTGTGARRGVRARTGTSVSEPGPADEDLTVVAPAPVRAQRAAPVAAHSAPVDSGPAAMERAARAPASTPPSPPSTGPANRKRPRYPPAPADQLSFEDPAYHSPDDAPRGTQ
ncbi:MAG TPA: hypothetical protein VGY30_06915 [Solirubrobacteraceae bacterium]|jgi:hypothetical protein|nr:hypothetical protein [Solirubrobacteraceae bacterium]